MPGGRNSGALYNMYKVSTKKPNTRFPHHAGIQLCTDVPSFWPGETGASVVFLFGTQMGPMLVCTQAQCSCGVTGRGGGSHACMDRRLNAVVRSTQQRPKCWIGLTTTSVLRPHNPESGTRRTPSNACTYVDKANALGMSL